MREREVREKKRETIICISELSMVMIKLYAVVSSSGGGGKTEGWGEGKFRHCNREMGGGPD